MSKQPEKTAPTLKNIFAVRLEVHGARACGPYKAGVIYKVGEDGLSNEEANRLVKAKGFTSMTTAQVTAAQLSVEEKSAENNNDTATKTGES